MIRRFVANPWLVALAIGAFLASITVFGSVTGKDVVICPFRTCTGHACPGCGLSRGIIALGRGDLAHSWAMHPMAMLIVGQALLGVVAIRRGWFAQTALTGLLAVNTVAFIAIWALRWRLGLLDPVVAA